MFVFPVYAALVWYACFRWRRQFLGFAALGAGVMGVLLLAMLDVVVTRWLTHQVTKPLFVLLLLAEAGIILPVGAFVVMMPRERVELPCRACGYELLGLEIANPTCPECGLEHAARKLRPVAPLALTPPAPIARPRPAQRKTAAPQPEIVVVRWKPHKPEPQIVVVRAPSRPAVRAA